MQELEVRQRNVLKVEDLEKITTPTLIIWGRNNPFGAVPEADKMHKAIKGSQMELFEECGHWPQHEKPELYNKIAIEFLNKHRG